jgi:hypothetical protein
MPNPYTNTYMPNGFEDANQQGLNPVFQNIGSQQAYMNQQLGQGNQMAQPTSHGTNVSGLNPLTMAMMLRGGGGNVAVPAMDGAQMSGVSGMGGSMGTGLTQNPYNSGVGFNPNAQSGGYGIKF